MSRPGHDLLPPRREKEKEEKKEGVLAKKKVCMGGQLYQIL